MRPGWRAHAFASRAEQFLLGKRNDPSNLGDFPCEDVLWLLGSVSGLLRVPFDAALIAPAYAPPYGVATIYEAAQSIGFKTGACGVAKRVPHPPARLWSSSKPGAGISTRYDRTRVLPT